VAKGRQPAAYSVIVSPAAERDLEALPKRVAGRIADIIEALASEPRPSGVKKLKDEGGIFRVRHSDYRILFAIDDSSKTVEVTRVRNRKDAYRKKR
jgi:mRNA interferase RelE/StbE